MGTFLVIENYKPGKTSEIYQRFPKHGRMLADKVQYIDCWVEENLQICYQIMKSKGLEKLNGWMEHWNDLVNFEIIPVLSSEEATEKAKE